MKLPAAIVALSVVCCLRTSYALGQTPALTSEEENAAYCYGVVAEMDHWRVRNSLYDYLKDKGLERDGSRPLEARKRRELLGQKGADVARACRGVPDFPGCKDLSNCGNVQPTM